MGSWLDRLSAVLLMSLGGGELGVSSGSGVAAVSSAQLGNVTQTGTYTITVTGAAPGMSQSVQLTLNVE
jgi:hypothetical protein